MIVSTSLSNVILGIPQGNQLFHPLNLLTDHLKQTAIMEPLKTDYKNAYVD